MKKFVILAFLLIQGCSNGPAQSGGELVAPAASSELLNQELEKTQGAIAALEAKLDELEHEEGHQSQVHGSTSPEIVDILKTLQLLNQRLMSIERKLGNASSSSPDPELTKKQVVEVAKKSLSEHELGGQSFFTAPSLIEAVLQDQQWKVGITFKKNKSDSTLYLAQIICDEGEVIDCNVIQVVKK